MRRAGGGSIINTASFVAIVGAATPQLAYTSSKGAVLAMTRELAVIHAREGIRVNALCPGPVRTELLMKFLDTDEKKERRLVHGTKSSWRSDKHICSDLPQCQWDVSARATRWRLARYSWQVTKHPS